MLVLMDVTATGAQGSFPWLFTAVYVVGFIAAVSIGSVAWYNSKRPPGWEDQERPNIVPDIQTDDSSES
ncbi:photosystem II assembly protein Psb35 [Leptolyngbya sp. AN02str]|uniref:photosystem II assembly protein Psb35 n=1 Tax=Leptolyngbya sp. AN02str TaxID=3423363 RepID=UPI003D31D9CF